ncbi:rhoptry neck protein 5, putative [Babesia caballi]|uniref:Rhoptry neck protein 5, putative n=1 Tax=Babesia caballi TaxID=5871 RepID=A0AAV4LRQ9_BABCB|nr:rhoptry neck protein 5, putative [Babesia caballi]
MEICCAFLLLLSLWSVQATPLLQNPFEIDAPLPVNNLLQIGGMQGEPDPDVLPEKPVEEPSMGGEGSGVVHQDTPAEAVAESQAEPVSTAETQPVAQEAVTPETATIGNEGQTEQAPEAPVVDSTSSVPPTSGEVEGDSKANPTAEYLPTETPITTDVPSSTLTGESSEPTSEPLPTQVQEQQAQEQVQEQAQEPIPKEESKTNGTYSETNESAPLPERNFPTIDGMPLSEQEAAKLKEQAAATASSDAAAGESSTDAAPAIPPVPWATSDTSATSETPSTDSTTTEPKGDENGAIEATAAESTTAEPKTDETTADSTVTEATTEEEKPIDMTTPPPTSLEGSEATKTETQPIPTSSFDEKDMEKGTDATKLDIDEAAGKGNGNMSKMTMDVDQDWLNKEQTAEAIQKKMPEETGFVYNKTARMLTPVAEQPKVMGGVLQTLIDKEAELRRRHEQSVQIEHDLRLRVTRETADVVALLTGGLLSDLKKNHPLVFSRLMEPLRAAIAINQLNATANTIVNTYDRRWYVRSSPKEKAALLDNIRKDTGRVNLFAPKVKKPKSMTPDKERVYQRLDEFFNDFQCQKVVRGNQVAKQMLRMFDQQSGLYVAPFYTDVVPTLGSLWMIARFEKFYHQGQTLRLEMIAKSLPQMVGRFMVMIENGTVLPTSPELQKSLFSLSAVLSKIMDGVTEPRTFLGKRKYYGFMGMCDVKCSRGIVTGVPGGDATKSFVLNKQREILRWISFYLRDDLLRIDTMAQKILLELMFRTTNSAKYLLSGNNVELHLTSEYVKPGQQEAMLELPEVIEKLAVPVNNVRQTVRRAAKPYINAAKPYINAAKPYINVIKGLPKRDVGTLTRRFLSGYRLPGRRVNNKVGSTGISPYNAFKTPQKLVASLDDGLLAMVEVALDIVNLDVGNEYGNLYYMTFNTWAQLQTFHAAIHAFEPLTSKRQTASKTLGAVFRFLNSTAGGHIEAIPKQFLPFTSLIMQMTFFFQNSVEGYERGKLKGLLKFVKGLVTSGLKSRMGPSNFDELHAYFKPQVVYNRGKYLSGHGVVAKLVSDFKAMFLSKPAIPVPIIQLISVFTGLWARGSAATLDLADPSTDMVRKKFFLGFMSNRSDLPAAATDIVLRHCAAATPVLHLGCVPLTKGKKMTCKQLSVRTTRRSVLKVMQLLDATFDDPLDIVRVGSDVARRCTARPKPPRKAQAANDVGPTHQDSALLFSELAHRYHCYKVQTTIAGQLSKALLKTIDPSTVQATIDRIFSSMRTVTVKQSNLSETGLTLVCPFMEDAPAEMRKVHRDRIIEYASSKLTAGRRLLSTVQAAVGKVFKRSSQPVVSSTLAAAPLEQIAGCILVGTRTYDGIIFHGGYAPPEKIPMPESVEVRPGEGRVVYDGQQFVSEVEALSHYAGVKAVVMERHKGVDRRVYHLESGAKMDELQFGRESNDFVVRAHVLTTSSALLSMGYDMGNFIWCGYEQGWVADFALHNVIGSSDVPVYNGSYWVLSKHMNVADFVGRQVPIRNGEQITDNGLDQVNVKVLSGDGQTVADIPINTGDGSSFIKGGGETAYTFDTGYGDASPAAFQDLVRDAEFDPATNTLILNLDAPRAVLQESLIGGKNEL